MILYGASGHAKVIIDICNKIGEEINYILDDNKTIKELLSYEVNQIEVIDEVNDKFIITIGNNSIRKEIANRINSPFGIVIHPDSTIDSTVIVGEGTVIMAGSIINSSTKIGKHCIINTASSIDHDCILEDFVHISPNATLCGGVKIGEGTQIGAAAVIIPSIKIGKWCTIGAGTVIIKDVPDGATVVGNPGKVIEK